MNRNNGNNSGDRITDLPMLQITPPVSRNDEALIGHLFGAPEVDSKALASYIKGPLLVAVLIGVFCLPQIDELIGYFYPSAKDHSYTNIVIKMILGAVVYYIIVNWQLSRTR